jgi:alpha-D-ribose 1-methylphosphonate 5-triphosphate synthase subunit PhnL
MQPIKSVLVCLLLFVSGPVFASTVDIKNANYDATANQVVVVGKIATPGDEQLVSLVDFVTGKVLDQQAVRNTSGYSSHFLRCSDHSSEVSVVPGSLNLAHECLEENSETFHEKTNTRPFR